MIPPQKAVSKERGTYYESRGDGKTGQQCETWISLAQIVVKDNQSHSSDQDDNALHNIPFLWVSQHTLKYSCHWHEQCCDCQCNESADDCQEDGSKQGLHDGLLCLDLL